MTALLWVGFGLAIGAAVLHLALGLKRPLDRAYLSFAFIMALLAAYLYFEWQLYRSTSSEGAVEAMRRQFVVAHGFLAGILVFIPAYAHACIPRRIAIAFWGGLAALFIANLCAPYGIWFSAKPELVTLTFRGEPYTNAVVPPLTTLQYGHTLFVIAVFVLMFWCALVMVRRGERQRGATLAIAIVLVVVQHVVDVFRDAVAGSWPYVAEFGVVTWALIMSIQLSLDFGINRQRLRATLTRAEQDAAQLSATVRASLLVRDRLNTPLQTLELSLAMCPENRAEDSATLADLRGLVVEIAQLGRAVEAAANQPARAEQEHVR